ncbi:hypothetical protein SK128_005592 [Halocaridina rubra]|uniref:Ankyrin repeat protein n=1 Tax=Halocaridina rubra TaxID=373956 RepID=A0AAN9A5L2_HALRR
MMLYLQKISVQRQLRVAINDNDVSMAHKLFLGGVDPDIRFSVNCNEKPALCLSVENNAFDLVRLLIERGVSINQRDSDGFTALHISCSQVYPHLAELLLQARANVNAKTNMGQTPLHMAAMRGSWDLVELLLSHGADINALDCDGNAPLHYASQSTNPGILKSLLSAGGSPALVNKAGNTPLHNAVETTAMTSDVIHLLALSYPDALGVQNCRMRTPLHIAVQRYNVLDTECILEVLLKYATREDLNLKGILGHTPLHLAVLENRLSLLRLFLTAGASPDTEDYLGHTPLESAARDASLDAVTLLLAAGANTRHLIKGGEVDSEVQDLEVRYHIRCATREPPPLSRFCRKVLIQYLGPASFRIISETSLPPKWQQFLSFRRNDL